MKNIRLTGIVRFAIREYLTNIESGKFYSINSLKPVNGNILMEVDSVVGKIAKGIPTISVDVRVLSSN